eukprot:TRINITY_DN3943_c0_g6_i1.p1 TRINITY_DN3943_c0_g6~~TRINITY_DN3943_c0_g6_i1.p1  ORF type:complete len:446 (+),score=114.63 TRINITY_DN3943_c0_g6_i1:81-1418(+)
MSSFTGEEEDQDEYYSDDAGVDDGKSSAAELLTKYFRDYRAGSTASANEKPVEQVQKVEEKTEEKVEEKVEALKIDEPKDVISVESTPEELRVIRAPRETIKLQRKEGWLYKVGGKSNLLQRRWFFLKESLKYFNDSMNPRLKGMINLLQINGILVSDDDPKVFRIDALNRQYFFMATDAKEADEWMSVLTANQEVLYARMREEILHSCLDKKSIFTFTPTYKFKEGILFKLGEKSSKWQKRLFVLTSDSIIYKEPDEKKVLGRIEMSEVAGLECDAIEKMCSFAIITPFRIFFLFANNDEERASWMNAISVNLFNLQAKRWLKDELAKAGEVHANSETFETEIKNLKDGYLQKDNPSHSAWQKRWFTLYSDAICYRKDPQQKVLGSIELFKIKSVEIESVKNKKFSFTLVTPDRRYNLAADSLEERDRWVQLLSKKVSETMKKY